MFHYLQSFLQNNANKCWAFVVTVGPLSPSVGVLGSAECMQKYSFCKILKTCVVSVSVGSVKAMRIFTSAYPAFEKHVQLMRQ